MSRQKADAVVIGGGIMGAATTYYLAKAGLKVVLFEKGDLASGASGGCDAEICSLDHEPGFDANLSIESNKIYQRLVGELNWDIEYRQYGLLILMENQMEVDFMLDRMKSHMQNWIPVEFLEPKELYRREPLLGPGLKGGLWTPVDAACQSMNVCLGFAGTARDKYGAEIRLHEPVENIKLEKGRVSAVVTHKGEIETPIVVNCCGSWAPFIGEMVGLDIPIKPRQGQIVVIEPSAPLLSCHTQEARYTVSKFHPELAESEESDVAKFGVAFTHEPTASGTTLIGSARQFVGYNTQPDLRVVDTILKRATRFIPALKNLHCIRTYCGLRPYTPDHLSIISGVEEVPGFYINAGAEGDGIGIAPLAGLLMSQIIQKHEPIVDPAPLRWSRYTDNSVQV